jgi:folylpolyglutamate synthase
LPEELELPLFSSPASAIQSPSASFSDLPLNFVVGLRDCKWQGRCEVVTVDGSQNLTLFVDGAHTPESIEACAKWFSGSFLGTLALSILT